ncbi:lytic transglycosylase domain-containing protein [Gemmobacter caeruleus]|uniref:lytic transglycosylase domain-containing protein n=1 Tax=Gemmobacter caeruleus TaxID=2595004 RepID=UPI0011EEA825|nr:lytic transglycosylase domain-containing protein [Gemmobacter caeruleus]
MGRGTRAGSISGLILTVAGGVAGLGAPFSAVRAQDAPQTATQADPAPAAEPTPAPKIVAPAPPAFEDFTFRRVKAHTPGLGGKRITVQIDPAEQARRLAASPKVDREKEAESVADAAAPALAPQVPADQAKVAATYTWFWDNVPTAREAIQGRFPLALATLSKGPGGSQVRAPRMQHMQEIAEKYGTDILKATIGTEVSPALALAVIGVESAGRPEALSHAGAQGLMQLIPATAERFGVTDAMVPAQNIKGGVAYLDWLMKRFDRDPLMVLAAYNAGEGAVEANAGVPPYPETRDYVPKVLAAWQVAQGLCQTPPEIFSDPCVFRIIAAGG